MSLKNERLWQTIRFKDTGAAGENKQPLFWFEIFLQLYTAVDG